jgi:hypothetical protein
MKKNSKYITHHVHIERERIKRVENVKDFDARHNINVTDPSFAYMHVPVRYWDVSKKLKGQLALRRIETLNELRLYNLSDIENQPEQNHARTAFTEEVRDELKKFVNDNGGWFYEDHEDSRTIELQMNKAEILTAKRDGIARHLNKANVLHLTY